MKRALFFAVCLAACGGTDPASNDEALDAFIDAQMLSGGLPGVAVARIEGGAIAWIGVYGYADIEARRKVDEHTPFLGASLSKTVLGVLMMKAAEEGRFDLERPVDDLLGFAVRHPDHPDRAVTPRFLVTHTSGIVDDVVALGAGMVARDAGGAIDFARDYVAAGHFAYEPGTKHDYSNAGFAILGAALEKGLNEPLAYSTQREIFEPLGMDNSYWRLTDLPPDRAAIGYNGTLESGYTRTELQTYTYYPAISLRTSVTDYATFLLSFMSFGEHNGTRILSEASARAMREIQAPAVDPDQGIAFYYQQIAGRRWLGHTGSAFGYSNAAFFLPEENIGVVVLTNSDAFIRSRLNEKSGSDALYAIVDRVARSSAAE